MGLMLLELTEVHVPRSAAPHKPAFGVHSTLSKRLTPLSLAVQVLKLLAQ